jgi:hypothetical protein
MNQLIKEVKTKAETIINSPNKMPLDKFEYYSLVDPFCWWLLKLDSEKRTRLLVKLMSKYKDNLNYYSKISVDEQSFR